MASVLIIDKDEIRRDKFCNLLEKVDVSLVETKDFSEGFRALRRQTPDAVFINVSTEDADGIEALCQSALDLPPITFYSTDASWLFHLPIPIEAHRIFKVDDLLRIIESLASVVYQEESSSFFNFNNVPRSRLNCDLSIGAKA